jgi:hypothetical protein
MEEKSQILYELVCSEVSVDEYSALHFPVKVLDKNDTVNWMLLCGSCCLIKKFDPRGRLGESGHVIIEDILQ